MPPTTSSPIRWNEPAASSPLVSPPPPERRQSTTDRRESTRRSVLGDRRTSATRVLRSLLRL